MAFAPPSLLRLTLTKSRDNVRVCGTSCARVSVPTASWADARRMKPPSIVTGDTLAVNETKLPGVSLAEPLPLTVADLLAIVRGETPDAYPNEIVWTLLGWSWSTDTEGSWDNSDAEAEWRELYPDAPPEFIGNPNDYSPAVDRPIKKAVQRLQRSIATEHKNALRETLKPHGFAGWGLRDLTPNRTRRAACVNYILFWYRIHFPDYEWK